ncbi:MAG: 2,3,4,5-tetrahydropyridine-2,6-dicarboxylate N-succinyltransferase [Bacteroidales bacterium]|nr:2,3,4,5-tetrahydropyridine-2,6-dicarboxylate N-succinyltransferase [Bacteroidales bacterium]
MDISRIKQNIEEAFEHKELLKEKNYQNAVEETIALLDEGKIRVATPGINHKWETHEWIKKAILLYFQLKEMKLYELPPFEFYDKIPLKTNYRSKGVRVVPHAIARYGSFISAGVVMMPSYVNIGAYVDEGTMIDTWATVGSCAQIGKYVHLSGGVGIGGVLEPPQAQPVIIEDYCFIGSRSIIVEGVHIGREAVIGAGVILTASTKIIDVSKEKSIIYQGYVPPRSVVISGCMPKEFRAGTYYVPVALIIGERKPSTDVKTSLNETLRFFNVPV